MWRVLSWHQSGGGGTLVTWSLCSGGAWARTWLARRLCGQPGMGGLVESHPVSPAVTSPIPVGLQRLACVTLGAEAPRLGLECPPSHLPPSSQGSGLASGSLLPVPFRSPLLGKCGLARPPGICPRSPHLPQGPPTCPCNPSQPLGHLPVLLLPGPCRPCLVPYLYSCLSVSMACPPGELGDPSLHAL